MKKLLFIIITALLILSLAACSTQEAAPTQTGAQETAPSTKPGQTPEITPEPTPEPTPVPTPEPTPEVITEYIETSPAVYSVSISEPSNPYNMEYQSQVDAELSTQISSGQFSMSAPFISIDPYGTNQLCMLVHFVDAEGYVSYTVNSPHSFASYTKKMGEISSSHSLEVFGLFPNAENEIVVSLYNEHDQLLKQATYTIDVPSIRLSGVNDSNNPLSVTLVASEPGVSDGLFGMMGTIESGHGYENVYFYDNEGYLRGMLETSFRADTMLQLGDSFLYPYNTKTIVHVSMLGKTLAIYNTENYTMHHDLEVDKDGNIMALVTKNGSGYKEDWMITIDKDTGEIIHEYDFKTLFGDNAGFYKLNGTDWLHANSIDYIDQKGGNLIISSRESSMLFSITGVDTGEYILEYLINEGTNTQKLGLEDLALAPIGEVNYCIGQHSAYYIPGNDENHYQIVYYNNFYSRNSTSTSSSHPTGNLVKYEDIPGVDEKSFMSVLDIDTDSMTFSEAYTIEFRFSRIRSSAIKYEGNYIASSTQIHQVVEVDADFNVVLELLLRKSGVYRCNKYNIFD